MTQGLPSGDDGYGYGGGGGAGYGYGGGATDLLFNNAPVRNDDPDKDDGQE